MPGATPLYAWPYPISTDSVKDAVSTIPQALATQMESTLSGWGGIAAPGAWATITGLAAGWANYGSGYRGVQYRKIGQALYLRGTLVRSGSAYVAGTNMFQLPVGFRPTATDIWAADAITHAQLQITNAGIVSCGNAIGIGAILTLTSPPIWLD